MIASRIYLSSIDPTVECLLGDFEGGNAYGALPQKLMASSCLPVTDHVAQVNRFTEIFFNLRVASLLVQSIHTVLSPTR